MEGAISMWLAFSSPFFLVSSTLYKHRQTQSCGEWTLSQTPKILCHSLFYDTRALYLYMQGKVATNYCNCGVRSIGVRGGGSGDGGGDDDVRGFGCFGSIRASLILYDRFLLLLYCRYFAFTVLIAW